MTHADLSTEGSGLDRHGSSPSHLWFAASALRLRHVRWPRQERLRGLRGPLQQSQAMNSRYDAES